MAHRNRWFTELKNGGSFHGELLNNQMVTLGSIELKNAEVFPGGCIGFCNHLNGESDDQPS